MIQEPNQFQSGSNPKPEEVKTQTNVELNDGRILVIKEFDSILEFIRRNHLTLEDALQRVDINTAGNIVKANFSGMEIFELTGISGFAHLQALDISSNPAIREFGSLSANLELEVLHAISCGIQDLRFLSQNTKLKELHLASNHIKSVYPLAGLRELELLDLASNSVSDTAPLQGCENLKYLKLTYNALTSIKGVEKLRDLSSLALSGNQIQDIDQLSGLDQLSEVDLANNRIVNIDALQGLKSLSFLALEKNPLEESAKDVIKQLTKRGAAVYLD